MSRLYADPDCAECNGEGFIYGESLLDGGHSCHCMLDALKEQNMQLIWPSLAQAKEFPELRKKPPLRFFVNRNVWITSSDSVFRAHLKATAFSQSSLWNARVFSDKDLVAAWLKTARAQGHKIYDSEIDNHNGAFVAMDIDELVEPFDLVILKLGVKQAPNKETPNVLLEALRSRQHLGKPTWIIDQPDQPINDVVHRGYSETLEGILKHWLHFRLVGPNIKQIGGPEKDSLNLVADVDVIEELLTSPAPDGVKNTERKIEALEEEEEEVEEEAEKDEIEESPEEPSGLLSSLKVESDTKTTKKAWGAKKPWGNNR